MNSEDSKIRISRWAQPVYLFISYDLSGACILKEDKSGTLPLKAGHTHRQGFQQSLSRTL